MTSSSSLTLTGHSGASYAFEVFPLDAALPHFPVVYFVFQQVPTASDPQLRQPVYVGHARDAAACMHDYHRQGYVANGATHIALHVDYDERVRAQKVTDLACALTPVCNG